MAETVMPSNVQQDKVVNNLTTTAAGYVLDARQGKALSDQIVDLQPTIFAVAVGKTVTQNAKAGSILFTGHSGSNALRGIYYVLSSLSVIALMDASALSVSISDGVLSITNNASAGTATCSLH